MKAVPERVLLTVSPFYMWLTTQNWVLPISNFLKVLKIFIPRSYVRKHSMGWNWFSFGFFVNSERKLRFQFCNCNWPKKSAKNLFPPKGCALALPGVQIFFWFIVISERKLRFQFCIGNRPKKIGPKPLSCGWNADGMRNADGGWSKVSFDFPYF